MGCNLESPFKMSSDPQHFGKGGILGKCVPGLLLNTMHTMKPSERGVEQTLLSTKAACVDDPGVSQPHAYLH